MIRFARQFQDIFVILLIQKYAGSLLEVLNLTIGNSIDNHSAAVSLGTVFFQEITFYSKLFYLDDYKILKPNPVQACVGIFKLYAMWIIVHHNLTWHATSRERKHTWFPSY
ncbi:hypothetical protein ACJX0J_035395, partial [Zea mays]